MTRDSIHPVDSAARLRMEKMLAKQRSCLAPFLFNGYRFRALRPVIRALLGRFEGGIMISQTWRRILRRFEEVELGTFSRGAGIQPGLFPAGTKIGNFSSFAAGFQVLRRNHPPGRFSQHPLFFNRVLGLISRDAIPEKKTNPLIIGSDVWVGMNVIICPGCHTIGNGAIIGAGAVVTRDIPPFTIVGGNPARPIRKRFSPEVEAAVAASEWWLRPLPEILAHVDLFTQDITDESLQKFAATFPPRATGDGRQ